MRASLDYTILDEIRQLQSAEDPNVLAELLALFLDTLADRAAKIEAAVAQGDSDALRAQTHTLKSSAANIGALRLADHCGELEKLGTARQTIGVAEIFAKTKAEITEVRRALESVPELRNTGKKAA